MTTEKENKIDTPQEFAVGKVLIVLKKICICFPIAK